MFPSRRLLLSIVLTSCLVTVSSPVWAGDELSEEHVEEETDEADTNRAQEAFDEGARYYYDGDYSSAIVEFRRADQIHPHPIFQHNIARTNIELDRPERAYEAALEAQQRADELPPEAAATNSAIIAGYQTVFGSRDHAESAEPAVADIDATDADSHWGSLGWAGAGILGAGVAAISGAAVLDRSIVSAKDDLEDETDPEAFDQQIETLESRQTVGRTMLWSGVALGAIGTSLVVWELATIPDDGGQMAVSPSLDRPGIDVLMRW